MLSDKIIIIPDIHNRWIEAENIIELEGDTNKIIFLGDYFDSFGDEHNPEITIQTAQWLNKSVQDPDRIHLFGNHDLWYSHGSCQPYCAGNTEFKRFAIKQYFNDWNKLKFHCWVDDWLCTHAGLSNRIYQEYKKEGFTVLELMCQVEMSKRHHPLVSLVGEMRGGIEGEVGGILWCDYDEFEDIAETKQIFGHTNRNEVRSGQLHHCIDTHLENYAVYEDGKMTIKSTKDLYFSGRTD